MKKVFLANILILLSLSVGLTAQATAPTTLEGLEDTAKQVDAFNSTTVSNTFIQDKAGLIINTALSFVGVIFLILMIYAGISWMTAQGNENKVTEAKTLIINSIIGIIIVFAAYALTSFLGNTILK